jgi:Ni2+-binding GTPase involved in maturation of urease and hydrogenase
LAAVKNFKKAGLAGPIGAGKTYNLCLSYLQRDTLEDASPAQVERDLSAGQQCHSW